MGRRQNSSEKPSREYNTISHISVHGFKSIGEEQHIDILPLTILAGANSSGKSSMMQPTLLLKQTLEAQYDPGALLLNGPNAKFTTARQFLSLTTSQASKQKHISKFSVSFKTTNGTETNIGFQVDAKSKKIELDYNTLKESNSILRITKNTSIDDINKYLINVDKISKSFFKHFSDSNNFELRVTRDRCFFDVRLQQSDESDDPRALVVRILSPGDEIGRCIQEIIHLPGLRGNPERSYPVTAIGKKFPGTFESYVAAILSKWGSETPAKLQDIGKDLDLLGLTWKVETKAINDTQVEIRVGRLKRSKQGGAHDLVNIADVGFGVSQTLPVVVALRTAQPGQLVYIEQPEIHLHPMAQVAMAELLANAANRGVRVVVETHSSLLLLAVQSLVAERVLEASIVKLHWFIRDDSDGSTRIQSAELDYAGRFGDWPEDFGHVALEAENRYLNAAEDRINGE